MFGPVVAGIRSMDGTRLGNSIIDRMAWVIIFFEAFAQESMKVGLRTAMAGVETCVSAMASSICMLDNR